MCPAPDRLRAPLETALSTARRPVCVRRTRTPRSDPVWPCPPLGAPLPLAGRRTARPLRLPSLAVLRPPARPRGLPGRTPARPRRQDRHRGTDRRACADKRFHSSTMSVRRPLRSSRSACWRPACCAAPTASTPRPRTSPPGSTSAPTSRSCACCGSSRAGTTWPARSPARRCSRRSSACPFASRAPPSRAGWRSSICFAPARAASRRCSCSNLEEGSLPRRSTASPFLDDDARRDLDERTRSRLVRPDTVARERFLFYAACTRPSRRLTLVREAATDDGAPRQASPFWHEVRALFDPSDVARWTRRRALSALTWPLDDAPTERERLRSLAALAAEDASGAEALALANGWERRLERARSAFERPTTLSNPAVLAELAKRMTFNVTELEAFATCSSIWFVERVISPRSIDAEVDAKLRGSIAHTTLHRFYAGLPKEVGIERVEPGRVEDAVRFLRRCLDEALEGVRQELTDLERRELEGQLWRDLERFVRDEAETETPLVPRRFEVSFGTERSPARAAAGPRPGRLRALREDRPHRRRPVQRPGESSGTTSRGRRPSRRRRSTRSCKLQIPLYMLVLRDLVGIEPLGGLYRALAGDRDARGLLRASAREDGIPGFQKNDYRDEDEFWAQIERATEHARGFVGPHPRWRRPPRPARRRRMPDLVRPRSDVPGEEAMSTVVGAPNPEQVAAIEAPGLVFVSAGAGTGKTTVLVERFAKAVCERGLDVDSLLVITYTERAAGELRDRIRARLVEAGRAELARELDAAWISTIHGFCLRLLKAHPFAAGIDPRFRVLDEAQARVLQREAFEAALDGVLRRRRPGTPRTARHVRDAGAAADADRRARDAPRSGASARPRARRAARAWRSGSPSSTKRLAASWRTRTPASPPGPLRCARGSCWPSAPCPSGCSTWAS